RPFWTGEKCKTVKSIEKYTISPPRHPHRKGGDAFAVDRAVMPAPTNSLPDKSEFTCKQNIIMI
ncbi:MAG: hypothetical protein IJK23_14830, partial [Clostridia bacterium]|nr:hypothetical protein [Clostridia bacterium]